MIPKSGYLFPACAKPKQSAPDCGDASAGEGGLDEIMLGRN
jgi:hypothetical protein